MEKKIQHKESRGLPGGPNEMFTYTTGIFSTEGFRMDSPDVNNYENIIPSGSITMKERDGSPLRKGPIHGVDNLGNEQVMYPGYDYEFPGTEVTERLMAKMGGGLLDKTIKCSSCGWEWKAADGGKDIMDCHKCPGKGLVKAEDGGESGCPENHVWDQYSKKCVRVYSLANDQKFIDSVGNWAMQSDVPDKISSEYNEQIKNYLYSGAYGYDPKSGSLYKLPKEQKTVVSADTKKILAKQENKAAYTQSIIDAGYDPKTFGKSKGTNVITGEQIYGDKSQEDIAKINREALNNFITEGHEKAILKSPFNIAANFTPMGMAAGVMQGAANLLPDAYNFAKDPSWSGAGAVGMDALMMSPAAKGLGKALSFNGVPKELPGSPNVGITNLEKELRASNQWLKKPLSEEEIKMYVEFEKLQRFHNLPKTTNKESLEVLENFKTRIQTPEGIQRMKELGINNDKQLQKLEILEDPNTFGYYSGNHNKIVMNPSSPLPKKVTRHEIEHGVQDAMQEQLIKNEGNLIPTIKRLFTDPFQNKPWSDKIINANTEIDDLLSNLKLRKEGTPNKVWQSNIDSDSPVDINYYKPAVLDKQKATDYFLTGSEGREKSAFLGEVQQYMMDAGTLPKKGYIKVTPEMVKKTMVDAMFDEKGGGKYLRLFNIMKADPENYELVAKGLNKMLGITSVIGLVTAATQYQDGGEPIAQTDAANTVVPSPLIEYVVRKGDTLSKIASENNTSISSIMKNNEGITDPNVIRINQKISLVGKSPDAPQEEVYKDWNTIRDKKDKINKLSDEQKIVSFYNDKPEESYLIVDKKNAVMKLYTGGNLTKSFEVGVGQNPGDAQTVTKVKNGKTDWSAGNKSTGAGIYTISNINPASEEYYNEPSFNLKNENGIEVATTIHGTPKPRIVKFNNGTVVDNRMTNGCINGKCQDLKELYGQLDLNTKVYILPEDVGNNFQIIDGKPALKVSSQNRVKYNSYVDQTGTKQKGQGANQTTNTLVYKPVKAVLNEAKFKEDVFQWNDFNDEKEYISTTKPFVAALSSNKRDVMKAAKISSDVYNELAKMAFGIYGTESNYGDTHSAVGNLARAANKALDPKSASSPDYKSKYETYGADEKTRSVGLTQIRWNYLNEDEKKALKQVGITSNKDFLDPKKAAIGTVTILGIRYNQQLNDKQKQDLWKYLPTKWNNRSNYGARVKSNSSYLSFKQLDKKQDGGEPDETSWTAYLNPANWGTYRYDEHANFKKAFRAARNEGESDFLWHGTRYTTELKKPESAAPVKKPKGITPELLIRQAYRESAFNPNAVSPAGYKGIGQIGEDVIKDYKKANNITGNIDPFNIKQNSDVQKYSMNELYNSSFINKPNQSEQVRLAKTLASYNWGRGNVANLLNDLKEEGVDIYNSLDWINKLPDEPKNYINDILFRKNTTFNNDFSKALSDQKNKPIKSLYGLRNGGESKPGPLMIAYNRLPKEKKMGGAIINRKEFGGQLNSGNITMYKDYIKGNIGNEIEVVKNYDKLNRMYYSKAKELGMTAANYIMTYIVGNS